MSSAAQGEPSRRGYASAREPAPSQRQGHDRRVVLEPKVRKGAEHDASAPQDNGRGFEPVPPPKTARPPKRPLTYQDFPELSQGGTQNGASPNSIFRAASRFF